MKTIAILIVIFGLQYPAFTQNSNSTSCSIIYSDEIEAYFYEDSAAICNEIIIQNLPPLLQSSTPLKLNFVAKGRYSFKKAAGLKIPDDYNIYLEDQLTGLSFNLKTEEVYSFSFNRAIPDRFVLNIKPVLNLTAKNPN
jgi:hypothetical protein